MSFYFQHLSLLLPLHNFFDVVSISPLNSTKWEGLTVLKVVPLMVNGLLKIRKSII